MFWWAYLADPHVRHRGHAERPSRPVTGTRRASSRPASKLNDAGRHGAVPGRLPAAPTGTAPAAGRDRWPPRRPRWSSWASGLPGTMAGQLTADEKRARATSAGSRSRPSTGGAGAATDGFGGGNGFAVGKDAPPEAIDFLKFISSHGGREPLGRPEHAASCRSRSAPSRPSPIPDLTSVLDGAGQGRLRPALPGPGDHPGARRRHQRRGRDAVAGRDPGRRRHQRVSPVRSRPPRSDGPAEPARSILSHRDGPAPSAGPSARVAALATVVACSCCPPCSCTRSSCSSRSSRRCTTACSSGTG